MEKLLKNYLASQGCKMTKQRKAILDVLSNSNTCMSAEEIYSKVKTIRSSTCLTTVYRTIDLLASKNLLNKINLGDNRYRYEINTDLHHHHIICLECKKIVCLEGCPVEEFEKTVGTKTDFKITGHRLELYGYCSDCK